MSFDVVLFDALAAMAVFSAFAMVAVARSAVSAATALLACLSALSGVLVLLGAELVGIVQLVVQAGSVTVLLLMIFLLVGAEGGARPAARRGDIVPRLLGCVAAAGLALAIMHAAPVDAPAPAAFDATSGAHRRMGLALFRHYGLPLQILALLLLAAIVGSVTLAARRTEP